MSYLVLARKYRPQGFDGFVGQNVIAETLRNAIRLNRVAHAYLFSGPRGVGKTSMARVFAKALNCVNGPTPDPCGTCEQCTAIASGQDIDVIEIDGASNRGIDEIRDIRQNVRYAAARSRFKIYYIDEVHMLTEPAFNALLKTLEEPPAHVKFIFATTAAAKLPETILSRIQRFDFRRISNTDIVKKLKEICKEEKVRAPGEVLLLVARRARGSLRDALSLFDQILSFCGDAPDMDAVAGILGALGDDEMAGLIAMIRRNDSAGLVRTAGELLVRGMDVGEIVDQLIAYLRDLLVARVCGPDADLLDRPPESAAALVEVAKELDPERILYMGQMLNQAKRRIREGQDGRIVLEMALVKLAQSGSMVPIGEILERLAALEDVMETPAPPAPPKIPALHKPHQESFLPGDTLAVREARPAGWKASAAPAPEPQPSDEHAESGRPVASSPDADLWSRFLEKLHQKSLLLHSFLLGARLERVENGLAVIGFGEDRRAHHDEIERHENKRIIENILSDLCGRPTRFRVVNGTGKGRTQEPPLRPSRERKEQTRQSESAAARDEIVREALDLFGGRVVREDSAK